MITEKFDELVEARCEKIKKVLKAKASEYIRTSNRHENFEQISAIMSSNERNYEPVDALMVLMGKHLASIAQLVDDMTLGDPVYIAVVQEKIGDAINYLILLEGMFADYISMQDDIVASGTGAKK